MSDVLERLLSIDALMIVYAISGLLIVVITAIDAIVAAGCVMTRIIRPNK